VKAVRSAYAAILCTILSGCAGFAPHRLYDDQLGYSRSLGDSQKAQTLLNIVRMRYADTPIFLNTTQVISGYSLQQSLSGSLNITPSNPDANSLSASPGVTMTQSPTFTFQPVTGEALAQSVIRPLSPAQLLPLSVSGMPIDVLFRLAVQAVNGLHNSSMLDPANRQGSPGFYKLLRNLRRLQVAGLLGTRIDAPMGPDGKTTGAGQLLLTLADSPEPENQALVRETRRMLGMGEAVRDVVVDYGGGYPPAPGHITLLTRPILGVLGQVASETDVPPEDIARGLTVATARDNKILGRPTVIVRASDKPAKDAFASVRYRDRWYWIDNADFDSKIAFSILQTLLTLAQTTPASSTVVTIPAR
jgi:hypothetical protein